VLFKFPGKIKGDFSKEAKMLRGGKGGEEAKSPFPYFFAMKRNQLSFVRFY